MKFDGYRMQVHKTGRSVTFFTRNGADWTERFPHLAALAEHFGAKNPDERFELLLDIYVDGLARRAVG